MVGFNGEMSPMIEKIVLPIETKGVIVYTMLMVVNADFTYNAVIGIPWLH